MTNNAKTLAALATVSAHNHPDKVALYFRDQQITYQELEQDITRVANGLRQLGIEKGDRVALYMPNCPQFIYAYYGIQRLGGVVVPMNVMYKAGEIAYICKDSGAKALLTVAIFAPNVQGLRERVPTVQHIVVVSPEPIAGAVDWATLLHASAEPVPVDIDPEDTAVICYTSGTTGKPKGAMLSNRNFIANLEQLDTLRTMKPTGDDVVLLVLPLFHIYAMNVALNGGIRLGVSLVLLERFDQASSLEAMQKHKVTFLYGAPPMYVAWVNYPKIKEYDLSHLRAAFSGAAALPVKILEQFREATGVQIAEGYGLTETAPVATSNAAAPRTKPGTIGVAIAGMEIRVVDDNDQDVPPGTVGELICRGPNVMQGYYNLPEATAEAMRGGWFHTGDLVTVDAEGYYTVVDRKKDMINVSGFNVYPREVEEVLYHHPKVLDASVVQCPDEFQGEAVMAFVVLKPGQEATEEEIIAYCRSQIAAFKCPRFVTFRESLPKNPTGKVLRRELRDEAAQIRKQATVNSQ